MALKNEKDKVENEAEKAEMTLVKGFHVMCGNEHLAGPYNTLEDAHAFIDGHNVEKGRIVQA
jgi:hypothetical protein